MNLQLSSSNGSGNGDGDGDGQHRHGHHSHRQEPRLRARSARISRSGRGAVLVGLGAWLWSAACAPTIKRDLSKVPAGQVGFDDLCGLQAYFDDIEARKETAPLLVSSTEIETQRGGHALRAGRSRFAFQGRAQIFTLRRVLDENWDRLPEAAVLSPRVDLDVYWSERDGLRRVASTKEAILIPVANGQEVAIPYHVCLSELLYGAPLYHQRREIMGLPPIQVVAPAVEPVADPVPSPAGGHGGTDDHHETSVGGAGGIAGAGQGQGGAPGIPSPAASGNTVTPSASTAR